MRGGTGPVIMRDVTSLPRPLQRDAISRERLPEEAREEQRRLRVLNAATEVFAKRGYLETTVDHLVAAAGIGVGSFYALFQSKELCFMQVYESIAADVRDGLEQAVSSSESAPGQICACLQVLLEMIESEPIRAKVALIEVQTAGPRMVACHQRNLDAAIPLLRRCRGLSPFRENLPPTLEPAIVGGVAWLAHQRLATGEAGNLGALYRELVDIVLGPYFGEEQAKLLATQN